VAHVERPLEVIPKQELSFVNSLRDGESTIIHHGRWVGTRGFVVPLKLLTSFHKFSHLYTYRDINFNELVFLGEDYLLQNLLLILLMYV
jgi:hypothetical protein